LDSPCRFSRGLPLGALLSEEQFPPIKRPVLLLLFAPHPASAPPWLPERAASYGSASGKRHCATGATSRITAKLLQPRRPSQFIKTHHHVWSRCRARPRACLRCRLTTGTSPSPAHRRRRAPAVCPPGFPSSLICRMRDHRARREPTPSAEASVFHPLANRSWIKALDSTVTANLHRFQRRVQGDPWTAR
jgi:hypothetical protein